MFCQKYSWVMEELCWWIECNGQTVAGMGPYAYYFTEIYIKPKCLIDLWIWRAVNKLLPVSLFLLMVISYWVIIVCVFYSHQKRVFETVRNVNQVVKQRSMTPSPMNIPGSNQSSAMNSLISSCVSTPRSSFYGGDISNIMIDNKTNSIILETESSDNGSVP